MRRGPLIIGVVAAAVVALIIAFVLGGGSSGPSPKTASGSEGTASSAAGQPNTTSTKSSHHGSTSAAAAASPAETNVVVLNATEKTGLAHHFAGELQQLGYVKAVALGGRPAGASQVTVVYYAGGHQADGAAVAHALSISSVQPIEAAVSSLAGSASVAVVVGPDKAGAVP